MPNHAVVPFDLLASTYIAAVEAGLPPAKTVRERFRLSDKQWEHRRIHMGKLGWLPPGDPVRDGMARGGYGPEWVAAARAGLEAKLRERFGVVVRREETRARRVHDRVLRADHGQARQLATETRPQRARPVQRSGAVLDAFLGG